MTTIKHNGQQYDATKVLGEHKPLRSATEALLFLVVMLTLPLWLAPLLGIPVWAAYVFMGAQFVLAQLYSLYVKYSAHEALG